MNTSIIERELGNLQGKIDELNKQHQALEALLPFYKNGIIEVKKDFYLSVEPKVVEPRVYSKKNIDKRKSIRRQIIELAKEIADTKGVVLSKSVLDAAIENNLLPGRDRDKVARRIVNTFGEEVKHKRFKRIQAGKYKIK